MSRIKRKRVYYDFTPLHKVFGTKPSDKDKGYFIYEFGHTNYSGGYPSTRKGKKRRDLSPEAKKRIADKVRAYRLGRKHSQATKDKIAKKITGVPRPDMIGNKWNIWGHYA